MPYAVWMQLEEQYTDEQGFEQYRNVNDADYEDDVFKCEELQEAERFMEKVRRLSESPILSTDDELADVELTVREFCLLVNRIEAQNRALPSVCARGLRYAGALVKTALANWIDTKLGAEDDKYEFRRQVHRGFVLGGWDSTRIDCNGRLVNAEPADNNADS